MRTTMAIDDDILAAARAMAVHQRQSLGEVISALARASLHRPVPQAERNGVPLLPVPNPQARITLDLVNDLRDDMA